MRELVTGNFVIPAQIETPQDRSKHLAEAVEGVEASYHKLAAALPTFKIGSSEASSLTSALNYLQSAMTFLGRFANVVEVEP